MSEDFDREAERERLREKYEKDKQEREATEQMSELLLQGATMTNGHCSQCGDPIFRYDGQEFCPTCEKPVDAKDGADENGDSDEDGIEVRSPSEQGRVKFGSDGATEETADPQQGQPQETQQGRQPQQQAEQPQQSQPGQDQPQQPEAGQDQPGQGQPQRTDPQPTGDQSRGVPGMTPETGSLEGAEQSLLRTLTRFSEQAEAAEDPRKARDHLAAAKEAAEALAALRQ